MTEASSGNSRIHLCNTCGIMRLKLAVNFYDSPQSRRFSSLVLEGGYCIRCIHWGVLQGHDVRHSNVMGSSLAESILRVFTPPHVLRVHSTPWPISLPLHIRPSPLPHLTSTQHPDPQLTSTQHPDLPHFHSTPWTTSLAPSTLAHLTSLKIMNHLTFTQHPVPPHFHSPT